MFGRSFPAFARFIQLTANPRVIPKLKGPRQQCFGLFLFARDFTAFFDKFTLYTNKLYTQIRTSTRSRLRAALGIGDLAEVLVRLLT